MPELKNVVEHAVRGDRLPAAAGRTAGGDRLGDRQPAQRRGLAGRAELQSHVRIRGRRRDCCERRVIKLGGSLLDDASRRAAALQKIVARWNAGEEHRARARRREAHRRRAGEARHRRSGRTPDCASPTTPRWTIVVSVLGGTVNKMLVAELTQLGVRAAGISGCDGATLDRRAARRRSTASTSATSASVTGSNRTLVQAHADLRHDAGGLVGRDRTRTARSSTSTPTPPPRRSPSRTARRSCCSSPTSPACSTRTATVVPHLTRRGVEAMLSIDAVSGGMKPKLAGRAHRAHVGRARSIVQSDEERRNDPCCCMTNRPPRSKRARTRSS